MKPEAHEEQESSTTVKFNVGGKIYEISKSLLEGFPDTILADKAKQSSSYPIFIDRDPDRFSFCLDYMRDYNKVYLPETVAKMAVLEELKFFGFVDIDETKICDEKSKQNCVTRFHQVSEICKERIGDMENEIEKLRDEAEALHRKRERRECEIIIEKVVLKCLAASVERAWADNFTVNYQNLGVQDVQTDHYFIERCHKLGLRVVKPNLDQPVFNRSTSVCLSRKTNAEEQK